MKKVVAIILCLTLLLGCMPAAMADGEKIYTALYGSEVSTLNYLTSGTTWDQTVGANVVDTLVQYDSHAQVLPGLAERWEVSADELTRALPRRRGAKG